MSVSRILIPLLLLLFSCGAREECVTPGILASNEPSSETYKQELLRELKRMPEPHFYLEQYMQTDGRDYILVIVQQEQTCMEALMQATGAKGLEEVIAKKGGGYHGAELAGLVYEVGHDATGTQIICRSVADVVD